MTAGNIFSFTSCSQGWCFNLKAWNLEFPLVHPHYTKRNEIICTFKKAPLDNARLTMKRRLTDFWRHLKFSKRIPCATFCLPPMPIERRRSKQSKIREAYLSVSFFSPLDQKMCASRWNPCHWPSLIQWKQSEKRTSNLSTVMTRSILSFLLKPRKRRN